MLRTFIAIDLVDSAREAVAGLQGGIPGARWVADENFHLTLRFVGEVEGHVFDQLADGLERIRVAPFDVALSGVGHFPPSKDPKTLWVGVADPEPLVRLRQRVERVCIEQGLEPERRKFVPHVTVARLAGSPSSRVARFLSSFSMFRAEPFLVSSFHMYTSQLYEDRAVHTLEASFDLRA